jgi:hypothetical protein
VYDLSTVAGFDTEKLEKVLITFVDENVDDFPEFAHVRDAVDLANSGQHHY